VYIFLFFLSLIDGCCSSPMAPPNDIWLTHWKQNYLLYWVHDSALCRTFLWGSWDPPAHSDGLW
jgi:hypothetical protein